MDKEKIRTFVLIKNLPPSFSSDDELKDVLRGKGNELMGCIVSAGEGSALALYGSKAAAAAACKEDIFVDGRRLLMRAIKQDAKSKVEDVLKTTIMVEGEVVEKRDIAPSKGYEEVMKGLTAPLWCKHTKNREDCPMGTACRHIHKKEFQVSQKRKRDIDALFPTESSDSLLSEFSETMKAIPNDLAIPFQLVRITSAAIQGMLVNDVRAVAEIEQGITEAAKKLAISLEKDGIFVKMNVGGSAPIDFLFSTAEGLAEIRKGAPLPANGLPTSLERDRYIAKVLGLVNQKSKFTSASSALKSLVASPAVNRLLSHSDALEGVELHLVVMPWIQIDSVFQEARIVVQEGRVKYVVQRHDALMSMQALDDKVGDDELKATDVVSALAHRLDDYLMQHSQDLTQGMKVFDVVVDKSWVAKIVSVHDGKAATRIVEDSTLVPESDNAEGDACAPVWRRIKYTRGQPHYSRELLMSFKE